MANKTAGGAGALALSLSTQLAVGGVFRGQLATGESDLLRVDLVAGQTYSFAALGLGAGGLGVTDSRLVLRSATGEVLWGDESSGPGDFADLVFTARTTGAYILEVSSNASGALGGYGVTMAKGGLASLTVEMGAGALLREGLTWSSPGQATRLSYSFLGATTASDATGAAAEAVALSSGLRASIKSILAGYSDVARITFDGLGGAGTSDQGVLRFGGYRSWSDGAGAYASLPGSRAAADEAGDVWLNFTSVSNSAVRSGGYSHYAILHEIGHALGLDHPGDYNAAPGTVITYGNNAQFFQDSAQYTVMSYFDATATEPNAPRKKPDTLMIMDIYALQQLYGANGAARAGDTVYGFNTKLGGPYDFSVNKRPLLCIWDGAGRDRIDLSGFRQDQKIDLVAGHFSDVGGYRGNLSIARGVVIEEARGGWGSDLIYGNAAANVLRGGAGDDTLSGGGGEDVLYGGIGADRFVFYDGEGSGRILDFDNALDQIWLDAKLWGGRVLSHGEVVASYAKMYNGHVIFDFGDQILHLMGLKSLSGLENHIFTSWDGSA
jgi:serralysin